MDAMLWMTLPLLTAAGSALLAYFIMHARMEVAIAKEREHLVEAKARIKTTEEEVKRKSLDEFLADFRIEERHYTKECKSLFLNKKSMILQERLFFRTIPLSNWVEHELTVEEGGDPNRLLQSASIFTANGLADRKSSVTLENGNSCPVRMIG